MDDFVIAIDDGHGLRDVLQGGIEPVFSLNPAIIGFAQDILGPVAVCQQGAGHGIEAVCGIGQFVFAAHVHRIAEIAGSHAGGGILKPTELAGQKTTQYAAESGNQQNFSNRNAQHPLTGLGQGGVQRLG